MRIYITVQGDTWDMIAKNVYGNEKKMDRLMSSNPGLLDYLIFPAGVKVSVPDLDTESQADMPIWRR